MLAVGPTMDGEFPPHEPPPAGSVLYSPPPLQTPLCGPSVQVSPSPQGLLLAPRRFSGASSPYPSPQLCRQDPPGAPVTPKSLTC